MRQTSAARRPPSASRPHGLPHDLRSRGRQVWERFGHNAIWIHDPVDGTDQAYNYGLFDFAPGKLHPALRARADVVLDGGLSRGPLRGPVRARQPLGLGAGARAATEREGAAAELPALERGAGAPVLPLRLLPGQLLDPGARRDRPRRLAARCAPRRTTSRPGPRTGSIPSASPRTTRRSSPGCCSRWASGSICRFRPGTRCSCRSSCGSTCGS